MKSSKKNLTRRTPQTMENDAKDQARLRGAGIALLSAGDRLKVFEKRLTNSEGVREEVEKQTIDDAEFFGSGPNHKRTIERYVERLVKERLAICIEIDNASTEIVKIMDRMVARCRPDLKTHFVTAVARAKEAKQAKEDAETNQQKKREEYIEIVCARLIEDV